MHIRFYFTLFCYMYKRDNSRRVVSLQGRSRYSDNSQKVRNSIWFLTLTDSDLIRLDHTHTRELFFVLYKPLSITFFC